ncbi:MAG: AtpZ/AtpI family protein [Firmicutes bacterium]|nr:AtpZ/AtpI family protein [Bacillota bacterium]
MWRQLLYALGLVTQLGLAIVISAGLGWRAGLWLDTRLGRNTFFSIIGLVLGLASGFNIAYQLLRRFLTDGGLDNE